MTAPIAERWYDSEYLGGGITWIDEQHLASYAAGNIWLLCGADRDLVIDVGTGIGDIGAMVKSLTQRPVTAVTTVGYFDHAGGLGQFEERLIHRADSKRVSDPTPRNTVSDKYLTSNAFRALPYTGFDYKQYVMAACEPTRLLEDGDVIDLGSRLLKVIHLPGITDGSIGLLEETTGAFFVGDSLLDGPEIYTGEPATECDDADPEAFLESYRRLLELDIANVYPGHRSPFDRARMTRVITDYLNCVTRD